MWSLMRWNLFQTRPMRWDCAERGATGGKKLQLHPTDSTAMMVWKALGCLTVDGFVECDGLFDGLFAGGAAHHR
jgi:hypothetical protein